MELEVLTRFYSDVQQSILNPIGVASLLLQESIASRDLLDEVSAKATQSEKTASIMRHVEAAVRTNAKSFWVFVAVLEQSSPSCTVAGKMKEALKLQVKSAQKKDDSIHSPLTPTDDLFISQVYQEDFDAVNRKFVSLHHRVSDMLERNRSVPLKKLKRLLSANSDLRGPLKSARSFNSVMCIVLEHSSIINCSSLRLIAEHFNLPEVTRELDVYKEQVDEFCQKTIREHSYVRQFVGEQPKHFLSTQTITLKLEWNPDKKTLADIQSLIRKTFHSLCDLIHVDVISEGSVTVICYAPHYIMGALVQMAEENKSRLLKNSVSYLSIGYAVVLDSTSQEKEVLSLEEEVRDLKERNTSMLLSLTPLRERCVDLQSEIEMLKSSNLRVHVHRLEEENVSVSSLREELLTQSGEDKILMRQEITTLKLLLKAQQGQTQLSEVVNLDTSKKLQLLSEVQTQTTNLEEIMETGETVPSEPVSGSVFELQSETHSQITSIEESTEAMIRHSKVALTGVTPDSLRYMMEHQGVEKISFRMSDATTEQVEAIFQGLRHNTTLRELDVPRTQPSVDMSILSASLTVNNTLQDLSFNYDLDDHAMEQLSAGLRATRSVTTLTLQCHISETGVQHLATMLTANRTIQELNLSSTYSGPIDDHAMKQLSAGLQANGSVTRLTLRCRITDTGAQYLATMLTANRTIQELNLSPTYSGHISDHAMEQLSAGLRANRSVTKLKLGWRITDTGAHHFATMLAVNVTLQELDLSDGSITDNGVSHLSRALQLNNSVTDLDLSHNESITNTGAVALSEMLRVNKSLRELNLCGTSVGKEGATVLMEGLQHNQVLNELRLPHGLEEYCKSHKLYGHVEGKIWLGLYVINY